MTSNVFGNRALGGPAGSGPAAAKQPAGAARGEWNGLAVTAAEDPASLIADAAEELTFSASETVEKKVAERKKAERDKRVATVAPPREVVEKMKRRMEEKLARLLAAVRLAGGNPAAFRAALADFSSDPTERHMALLWLEAELAGEPSLAALAKREREGLEAAEAAAVQAGYNIDGVDTAGLEGPEEGRNLYRRTVLGHDDINAMLQDILERHGGDDFAGTVEYLRRAVGADLSAASPSTDKRELEAMNNDLYHLRALGNFTREFGADLGKIRERGGKSPLPEAAKETLKLLCRAKNERVVMLDNLKGILALEGERDATYDVLSLTECQRLAHRLPMRLFADEESRQRLLAATQKLLDAAVDVEESLAGGG